MGAGLALVLALSGCGAGGPAPATERLWVSALPKDARTAFTAFVTVRASDKRYYGSFYHGSMFRGSHDAFRWYPGDDKTARLGFLQDGSERTLHFTKCKPTTGFDLCLEVRGDPYGVERYQSRKRWVVGRGGNQGEVTELLTELAEDDADLASLLNAP